MWRTEHKVSSTSISSSSVTNCFAVPLASPQMRLSFRRSSTSLLGLSVASSPAPEILYQGLIWLLVEKSFPRRLGPSLCVSSTAVEKDRSFIRGHNAASRLSIGCTMSKSSERVEQCGFMWDWRNFDCDDSHRHNFRSRDQCKATVSCSVFLDV